MGKINFPVKSTISALYPGFWTLFKSKTTVPFIILKLSKILVEFSKIMFIGPWLITPTASKSNPEDGNGVGNGSLILFKYWS